MRLFYAQSTRAPHSRQSHGVGGGRTHLVHVALVGQDIRNHQGTDQPQLTHAVDGHVASREVQTQVVYQSVWLDVAQQHGVHMVGVDAHVLWEVVLVKAPVGADDPHDGNSCEWTCKNHTGLKVAVR